MPYNHLSKEETLEELDNAITVADLIAKLSRMDPDLIVTNSCKDNLPITNIEETTCDYCFDEIITRRIVSIY